MATLDTLINLITNAKQTPSGKIEWTDTSLKGIQDEVTSLFSTNAVQTTPTVVSLQTLSGVDSKLAVVEKDATITRNGLYFWDAAQISAGANYPADGGGYWNLIINSANTNVSQIVAGTNVTISPTGGTGAVTINASGGTAINASNWQVPTRLNATTFVNSNIYDDTNITKTASSGFRFNYGAKEYFFGDYTNGNNGTALFIDDDASAIKATKGGFALGLNIDYASETYSLGDNNAFANQTFITVNDAAKSITLYTDTAFDSRIDIDGALTTTSITNKINKIGGTTNRTFLNINDDTRIIQTEYANNPLGLSLSMANRRFTLGDTGSNNGAKLFIDDVASTVLLTTSTATTTRLRMTDSGSAIQLNCSNLELNATTSLTINGTTTTTSYTSIPRFLEVQVNGTTCYIPLYQ